MQKILVTGFAGFIGYHVVEHLRKHYGVVALDNFSPLSNYDIKLARAKQLGIESLEVFDEDGDVETDGATFYQADLCNIQQLDKIFTKHPFSAVIHLAALTGVRQSLNNPQEYLDANVKGFVNLLECAKKHNVKNVLYASSSSVYGSNQETPYTENQKTDSPISVYAASKKAGELFAHTYSSLYEMNLTGLRFFTVYGPWTRPDMAAYIFMKAIRDKKPIELFNEGKMVRDFTYVGDVVQAISLLIEKMGEGDGRAEIFNVGNHKPIYTIDFLRNIETAMQQKADIQFKPMQPGDMLVTNASVDKLHQYLNFQPHTPMLDGIGEMVKWFNDFYK